MTRRGPPVIHPKDNKTLTRAGTAKLNDGLVISSVGKCPEPSTDGARILGVRRDTGCQRMVSSDACARRTEIF